GENSTVFIGVGIDINIKNFPREINATSLFLETGKLYDIDDIFNKIIEEINKYLNMDNERSIEEINKYLNIKNRKIILELKNGEKECISLFVDYFGRLVTDCGIYEVEEVLRVREKG
ncbi:MAG: biotin--[acetyl-CoA-carboxylase] ligase, partial [Sulfolobaceae archaeon]